MNFKYGKIFKNNQTQKIEVVSYMSSCDYYSFIQEKKSLGLSQVIISSELMLKSIEFYFLDRKFDIMGIELMEKDNIFCDEIDDYIQKTNKDRGYFTRLMEKLKFLSDTDTIEILKVNLRKRNESGSPTSVLIQVNGIVRINDTSYEEEVKEIKREIERYFLIE
ncbi:hypothetical protein [Eubacterium callanderi]|uniref:hypothetical protein n=1 Tax=Eubacterium callanderi TaxID=53442 RepID=UPI003983DF9A